METKIAEFNYKLLNNILATNYNLFKWGKSPTAGCIYCRYASHDAKHLLWLCPSTQMMWQKISTILGEDFCWKSIIKGLNGQHTVNIVVSLVSYIIYKKFQVEKDTPQVQLQDVTEYAKTQLNVRLDVYRQCHSKQLLLPYIEHVAKEL